MVQWLGFCAPSVGGQGSIPGQGSMSHIPQLRLKAVKWINKQTNKKKEWKLMKYVSKDQSVQFCHSVMPDSLRPCGLQHTRPPCLSPTPGAYSNLRPLSQWCHPTFSSSVVPFSHLQSSPALGSSPLSQFFISSGQIIGVSASASVLPMNTQDWSPLGWTGWISLQSKGLWSLLQHHSSKSTTFSVQLSL